MHKYRTGGALLFLTALIWGSGFVAQKFGISQTQPFTFAAARFLIGGVAMLPLVFWQRKKHPGLITDERMCKDEQRRVLWSGGLLCGVFLAVGTILQQVGMLYTTAGKAGFITALYIIFVPIIGIFLKRKTSTVLWISVAVAVVGLYLLSIKEGFTVNQGDMLVFLCAIVFAGHILLIDKVSIKTNSIQLSCVQFFAAFGVCSLLMILFEKPDFNGVLISWAPLLYLGIFSGAVGFTLQIAGQKTVSPAAASVLLSMESLFAAFFGWLFLSEQLMLKEIFGCAFIFAAVLLSQVRPSKRLNGDQ